MFCPIHTFIHLKNLALFGELTSVNQIYYYFLNLIFNPTIFFLTGASSRYDDNGTALFKDLQRCSNVDLCIDPKDSEKSYTVDDPLVRRPLKISNTVVICKLKLM